jgi:hypothetical protein
MQSIRAPFDAAEQVAYSAGVGIELPELPRDGLKVGGSLEAGVVEKLVHQGRRAGYLREERLQYLHQKGVAMRLNKLVTYQVVVTDVDARQEVRVRSNRMFLAGRQHGDCRRLAEVEGETSVANRTFGGGVVVRHLRTTGSLNSLDEVEETRQRPGIQEPTILPASFHDCREIAGRQPPEDADYINCQLGASLAKAGHESVALSLASRS